MKPPGPEAPVVLVKWYDYAKWLLERIGNFPKSQRFVLGQRLAGQAMDVLDLLVEASYARDKTEILATVNRKMEVLRWTVRMASEWGQSTRINMNVIWIALTPSTHSMTPPTSEKSRKSGENLWEMFKSDS